MTNTYDQWKATPPEERWGCGSICQRCDEGVPLGVSHCNDCADELIADEAMNEFYRWEPAQ